MHNNSLFGNPFGGLSGLGPGLGLRGTSDSFRAAPNAEIEQIARQAAYQRSKPSDFDNGEIIDVEGREVIPGKKRIEFGENQ